MINTLQIAVSGLLASQKKLEASASNIANLSTTGSLKNADKAPYSAITSVQSAATDNDGNGMGVKSDAIPKNRPFVPAYAPDSPFADDSGLIGVPNVNLAEEAINVKVAEHSFKANLKIIEAVSELSKELLHIVDDEA